MSTEVLTNDPIGWDDGTYTIKRSEEYKGAFHEYSVPLKFHCKGGGKMFIDTVYNNEDIDGRIDVLVEFDCDSSGTYETLFNGIIDLSSYETDGEYTTVRIEKSDLLTKLMMRDEINVDLETTTSIGGATITAPQTTTLPMHSTVIKLSSSMNTPVAFTETNNNATVNNSFLYRGLVSHTLEITNNEAANFLGWNDYSDYGYPGNTTSTSVIPEILQGTDSNVQFPAVYSYEAIFQGTFHDLVNGSQTRDGLATLVLAYGRDLASATTVTLFTTGAYNDTTPEYTTSFDTVTYGNSTGFVFLDYDDKVWLYWYLSGTITVGPYSDYRNFEFDYDVASFKLEINSRTDATEAKSVMVHEAFNQVVDAIADSDNNFESDFYGRTDSDKISYLTDGCGSTIAITNGLNIREFPNRPILCSFKDLFQAMDCQHNIGMGIVDGKVRVEPLDYWYDSATKIITLENVPEYTVKNDNTKYINKIEIGYQKWESEFKGGLDDVNAKHEYSTIIASVKNQLSKLCKYIASTYTIEFTRRKNINRNQTEDWRYDNDNFLIACVRDAYGILRPEVFNDSFTLGTNYNALASAYNIRLTPKRMLLYHLNQITVALQKIQGDIRFVHGEGNTLFSCAKDLIAYVEQCYEDYNGVALYENQDIAWNDANAANISPIYLPEKYTFEYPLTHAEFNTIKNNPYGYIEFYKFSDDIKQGYILSMEYKMKTGLTNFELIKKA